MINATNVNITKIRITRSVVEVDISESMMVKVELHVKESVTLLFELTRGSAKLNTSRETVDKHTF